MKFLVTTFLSVFIFFANAQNSASLPSLEPYFNALITSDFDRTLDWYTEVLGLEVLDKRELEDRGFKQANLSNGNLHLEVIELASALLLQEALPDYSPKTKVVGLFKFGFKTSNFDGWLRQLQAKEANLYGNVVNDPTSGKRMLIVLDPDGNRIQIFEK